MFQSLSAIWSHPVGRVVVGAAAVLILVSCISVQLAPRPRVRVVATPFSTTVEIDHPDAQQKRPSAPDPALLAVATSATPADLAIGGDALSLSKVLGRLSASVAAVSEPARYNHALHVAIIDAPPAPIGSPTPRITLDLKNAGDAAVLLIGEGPTIWSLRNVDASQKGKLAIEAPASFDVENAPAGLLAGFKSEAFGHGETTSSGDYAAAASADRNRRFCSALRRWASLYRLPFTELGIWILKNPAEIKVSKNGLSTTDWPQSRAMDAQRKCDPRVELRPSIESNRNIRSVPLSGMLR